MNRALVRCIGSLALLSGVVAGCNNLIGADPPSSLRDVGGTGGVGGVGGRPKVGQAGTNEDAGEGGTIAAEGGGSGAPSAHAGTSGSAVGGGSSVAGEGGVSGSGATGGAASGASGGGAGGAAGGGSGAGPCTTQACLKPPGAHCSVTEECQTGVCGAENVCCNITCSNACTTCASTAKPGVCSAIDYSTSADVANCGACGSECSTSHITAACSAGKCSGTCESGYAHCSSAANVGCEVNTTNDAANCGACGVQCKYGLCTGSACVSTVWGKIAHTGTGEVFGTTNNGTNPGSIIAVPVSVTTSSKLVAIGLRAYPPNTTVHMYLSLFTSAGTTPGPQSLIAETGLLAMSDVTSVGPTEGPVALRPTLQAGDYFIVIVSDNTFHVQDETSTETLWGNSMPYDFAQLSGAIPSSASMKTGVLPAPDAYIVTTP